MACEGLANNRGMSGEDLATAMITRLARPAILNVAAYSSARSLVASEDTVDHVYLDANELGDAFLTDGDFPPRVNRYPEPQPPALMRALGKLYGAPESHLCVGAGADAAIDAVIRIFCEAGQDGIVITPPTYGYYKVAAEIQGARVLEAPLKGPKWALDHAAIERCVGHGAKVVFVCSPNNPTAHIFPRSEILTLAKQLEGRAILVVDEAYGEFTAEPSVARDVDRYPGLVVLRTLSKAWGLAGLRVGTAIAHPSLINLMHKVRFPYPLSRLSAALATTVLSDEPLAFISRRVARVKAERDRLAAELATSPYVASVWPSETNFLLVKCQDHAALLAASREARVIVRDRSKEPGLEGVVRITVGSPDENTRLIHALRRGSL
jgi:histidinol-phosphate aminotransferase